MRDRNRDEAENAFILGALAPPARLSIKMPSWGEISSISASSRTLDSRIAVEPPLSTV